MTTARANPTLIARTTGTATMTFSFRDPIIKWNVRERLVRALIEGEESGLSNRSVREIIASAKSNVTVDRDMTGS
jgi:hypothetical protein